jgi:hypothetical protein
VIERGGGRRRRPVFRTAFLAPNRKAFDLLYSTTARWKDDRIVEEFLFYDNGTFLAQVCLTTPRQHPQIRRIKLPPRELSVQA